MYNNDTINALLSDMSAWYGITFNPIKDQLKTKKITLSIDRNISLDDMIKFIEKILSIKIIWEGGDIYSIE